MPTTTLRGTWRARAGLLTARLLDLGLALATALVGLALGLDGDRVLWVVAGFVLALWVGFSGGPRLRRALSAVGVFGTVRLRDGRLELGRGRTIDLTRPFEAEARYQASRIEREYDLRFARPDWWQWGSRRHMVRKYHLDVRVLTLAIRQGDRTVRLVADETNRRPGPAYEVPGPPVRRVALEEGVRPTLRLWGADVLAVLGQIQQAQGYEAALLPTPEKGREDPRRALWPTWKTALGATVLVLAAGAVGVWLWQAQQASRQDRALRAREAARREREQLEAQGLALIGRRVRVEGRRGVVFEGAVAGVTVREETTYEPQYRIGTVAWITVRVDTLRGPDGVALPPDTEVPFRADDDLVGPGREIEVRMESVSTVDPAEAVPEGSG